MIIDFYGRWEKYTTRLVDGMKDDATPLEKAKLLLTEAYRLRVACYEAVTEAQVAEEAIRDYDHTKERGAVDATDISRVSPVVVDAGRTDNVTSPARPGSTWPGSDTGA